MQVNPRIFATPHRSCKKRKSLGTYGWVLLLLKLLLLKQIFRHLTEKLSRLPFATPDRRYK
jgi:hypothetical protein